MRSSQELIEDIVRKTGLSKERVLQLIQEKKQKVGGGFLSDAGATYLVAADLGVQIAPTPSSELTLSQLSIGLNEVTTVARVLSITPLRTYKKKDGTTGVYRRVVIYDQTSGGSVTLWDEKAKLVDNLGLKRGDVIHVIKAYVRSDLDMRPVLHLGGRGTIERVEDESAPKGIPMIDGVARDISELAKESALLAVRGKIASLPTETSYVRRDGTPSSLVSFRAAGTTGGPVRRIVVWGRDAKSSPWNDLKIDDVFILTSVKVRTLPHGEFEIHANDSSELITMGPEMATVRTRQLFRILSVGHKEASGQVDLLLTAADRKLISLRVRDGTRIPHTLVIGDVVALEDSLSSSQQVVVENAQELEIVKSFEPAVEKLPLLESFFTKIASVRANTNPAFLQVMALSRGTIQQLDTKRGDRVSKGELIVGDDTGEVTLTAWRTHADMFSVVVPGEKLWVLGFMPRQSYSGLILEAKSYSSVVQLRFRSQTS